MKLSENQKYYAKLFGISLFLSAWLYVMFPPKQVEAQQGFSTQERGVKALEDIVSELREIRQCQCKGK